MMEAVPLHPMAPSRWHLTPAVALGASIVSDLLSWPRLGVGQAKGVSNLGLALPTLGGLTPQTKDLKW